MGWDERFAGPGYFYGTAPAQFLQDQAWRIAPGAEVLTLAEGEGRNAVYLAEQGARVTALEQSPVALRKAQELARDRGVQIDWRRADLATYAWPEEAFDVGLGVFIQFAPPQMRDTIFAGLKRAVRPGGLVMLHGFALRQPGYGSGGPGEVAQLYSLDLLRAAFTGWKVLHQADYDADLAEGAGHSGRAALVDFVIRKPD
jgi:cyclopropane fatty-acyl-phospholipid synthase-like methyltransferase